MSRRRRRADLGSGGRIHRSPGEGTFYPARSSTPRADAAAAVFGRQRVWNYHVHHHRGLDQSHRPMSAMRSCEWCRKEGFIGRLFGGPRAFPKGVPPTITVLTPGQTNFPEPCFECGAYHPWVGA